MDTSMESLHHGGTTCGAIVRHRTPREVRVLLALRLDGPLRRVEATLSHPGDVLAWTSYTYDDGVRTVRLERAAGGRITADGADLDAPADTLPSLVETALLEDMLAGSATEAEYHRLVEPHFTTPHAAHFSVGNPTPHPDGVTGPDGEELGVVELFDGEEPVRCYWFDSHDLWTARDDTTGLVLRRVMTTDELLERLDGELADLVRTFV